MGMAQVKLPRKIVGSKCAEHLTSLKSSVFVKCIFSSYNLPREDLHHRYPCKTLCF